MRLTFHLFDDTENNGGREAVLIRKFLTVLDFGKDRERDTSFDIDLLCPHISFIRME